MRTNRAAMGVALATALAMAGCGAGPTTGQIDAATMPVTTAGTPVLSDQGAMQFAAYALGSPGRTAGRPADGALALASIDYLAGALYENPHWTGFPAITKVQMTQARGEVRSVLGVPPGTTSQAVVNGLIYAGTALEGGDTAAAERALTSPAFPLGPQRMLALLTNLPPLPQANVAAQGANAAITFGCDFQQTC